MRTGGRFNGYRRGGVGLLDAVADDDEFGHVSVWVVKWAIVMFAEPRVFEDVRLGELVEEQEEEMSERLCWLEFERSDSQSGDSGLESQRRDAGVEHCPSCKVNAVFIPARRR